MNKKWVSLSELGNYEELYQDVATIVDATWPDFITKNSEMSEMTKQLTILFPEYQHVLFIDNKLAAIVNAIPLYWKDSIDNLPDEGLYWAITSGIEANQAQVDINTLAALSITVNPEFQRQGISKAAVIKLKELTKSNHLERLIIPVRPSLKSLYPLIPIEHYINWKNKDGQLYDPWLRVHQRAEGNLIKICHSSMTVEATLDEWMSWTGMIFPESGDYVVKGALLPIKVDCESGLATYIEPNVWVVYE